MDNKLMNFINANESGFITWQQQHTGQVVTNTYMLENAITALGWFAQNYPAKTLTDGTNMTNAEIANMVERAINGLTLGMFYWMDERGTATYHENKAFSDLMQYQMTHKNNLTDLAKRSATYLKMIGAL